MIGDTADTSTRPPTTRGDFVLWKTCAWAGPVFFVGFLLSWAGIAGFLPPPAENLSTAQTAGFFADNEVSIRIGMEGVLLVSMFYAVWSLAIRRLMQLHERWGNFLSTLQFVGGVSTSWIALGCGLAWLTASFRASTRSPDVIEMLNDVGWMILNMTVVATMLQMFALGVWILTDERSTPAMPRWLAYLTFWMEATFLAVFLMPSFPDSPFAWHGLITYYVGLGAFFIWALLTCWYLLRAIRAVEREAVASDR